MKLPVATGGVFSGIGVLNSASRVKSPSTSQEIKSKKIGSRKTIFFMAKMFFNSLIKYKPNENHSLSATLHLDHVYKFI